MEGHGEFHVVQSIISILRLKSYIKLLRPEHDCVAQEALITYNLQFVKNEVQEE